GFRSIPGRLDDPRRRTVQVVAGCGARCNHRTSPATRHGGFGGQQWHRGGLRRRPRRTVVSLAERGLQTPGGCRLPAGLGGARWRATGIGHGPASPRMVFLSRYYRHPAFRVGVQEFLRTAPGIAAWGLMTGVAMVKSGIGLFESVLMALLVF